MYHQKYLKYKQKYLELKYIRGNQDISIFVGGASVKQKDLSKKIIHPIAGPKEITIVFKPFLVFNGNEFTSSYLTGIKHVDDIITERISNDHTSIKGVLPFYYKSAFYWFGANEYNLSEKDLLEENVEIVPINYKFKNGLIYLTVIKSNNNGFNESDYKAINIAFDPNDFGPDNYMLQDIVIYEGDELAPIVKQYDGDDNVAELAVDVIDILK